MGVPLKTEKRRACGKDSADKGQRRRAARRHRQFHAGFSMAISPLALRPPHPWLELAIEMWRLRCSVFRGTPMVFFFVHFKANLLPNLLTMRVAGGLVGGGCQKNSNCPCTIHKGNRPNHMVLSRLSLCLLALCLWVKFYQKMEMLFPCEWSKITQFNPTLKSSFLSA